MNTVLVLVLLLLVIFALAQGQVWIALGVGVLMVILTLSNDQKTTKPQMFNQAPDQGPVSEAMKEQLLRVKYQPGWDGNNWWEEVGEHWGTSMGRAIGLLR